MDSEDLFCGGDIREGTLSVCMLEHPLFSVDTLFGLLP